MFKKFFKQHLNLIYTYLILLIPIVVIFIFNTASKDVPLRICIGIFCAPLILHIFLQRFNLKVSLIALGFTLLALVIAIFWRDPFLSIYNNEKTGPIILGIIVSLVIYVYLEITQDSFSPLIAFLLLLAYLLSDYHLNGFDNYKSTNAELQWTVITFLALYFMFLSVVIFESIYFIYKYKIKASDRIRFPKLTYILMVGLVFLGTSFLSWGIYNIVYQKIDITKKIQVSSGSPAYPNEEGESVENSFDDKTLIEFSPVGYFKSDHPQYLKIEVFNIEQITDFQVRRVSGYYKLLTNYAIPTGEAKKEISIIYANSPNRILPTVGRVISFENKEFDAELGLLKDNTNARTSFIKYMYTDEPLPSFYSVYLYTYINPSSDRYQEVKALALKITEGKITPYAKAQAIEQYLIDNYRYTLSPGIADQKNPIDDFLLDGKKGYCTHFAAAMVTLLNTLFIPARMVGGYYSDVYVEKFHAYAIMNTDLHAWVEVYIYGKGWVRFDPTTYKLAEGENPKALTGGNRTGRYKIDYSENLTGLSTDPKVSFDDVFEKKKDENLGLEEKKDNPIEKTLAVLKKHANTFKRLVLGLLVVFLFVCSCFVFYFYLKNRKRYLEAKIEKKIRAQELKLRKIIIKKYGFENKVLKLSNKNFLLMLDELGIVTEVLREFYKVLDKILYSRSYSLEDLKAIEDFYKEIERSILKGQ